jgi:hypothetical protein
MLQGKQGRLAIFCATTKAYICFGLSVESFRDVDISKEEICKLLCPKFDMNN